MHTRLDHDSVAALPGSLGHKDDIHEENYLKSVEKLLCEHILWIQLVCIVLSNKPYRQGALASQPPDMRGALAADKLPCITCQLCTQLPLELGLQNVV